MTTWTANGAWLHTLEIVKNSIADNVKPRGMQTKEQLHHTTAFKMSHPVVYERKRLLSYKFMAAEALWILSGSDRLDFHSEIHKKLGPYSDDGQTMSGAYGPRIIEQFEWAYTKLVEDPDTRQCVIEIWRPIPNYSKDIPCTIALQFLIRKKLLHLSVFMRSSDVWMGLPYDMFSFSCVAQYMAHRLDIRLGMCKITAGSSHLYAKDNIMVDNVLYTPRIAPAIDAMPTDRLLLPILVEAANAPTQELALNHLITWR